MSTGAISVFLGCATIFLLIFSDSSVAWQDDWRHDQPRHRKDTWSPIPYGCQDVYNNFDACEAYIVGGYDDPLPQCCDGLVYLNNIAKNEYRGAFRICQCIEKIAARGGHPPYSEKRIENLYYRCNIHLSFPISERMDCNRYLFFFLCVCVAVFCPFCSSSERKEGN